MKHTCPKNGCEVQCSPLRLACPDHWVDVPRALQRELIVAWRARNDTSAGPERKVRTPAAMRHYLSVRKRCIDAMNGVT